MRGTWGLWFEGTRGRVVVRGWRRAEGCPVVILRAQRYVVANNATDAAP